MRRDRIVSKSPLVYMIVGILGSLAVLWALGAVIRTRDPNIELARTAREAMQIAEDAHRSAQAVRRTSSIVRILALVVGVTVPLIVALLVYVLQQRSEPRPEEVLRLLEKENLLDLTQNSPCRLPSSECRRLDGEEIDPIGDKGK